MTINTSNNASAYVKQVFPVFIFLGFMYLILFYFPSIGHRQYKEFFQYDGEFIVKNIRNGRIDTEIASKTKEFFFSIN